MKRTNNKAKPKLFIIVLLIVLGLIYLGPAVYYINSNNNRYILGTYINNLYCTGLTKNEVNSLLLSDFNYENIHIKTEFEEFDINPMDYIEAVNYDDGLNGILTSQKPFLWIFNSINRYSIEPSLLINETKLAETFDEKFPPVKPQNGKEVYIELTSEEGYILVDNKKPVLNRDAFYNKIYNSILACDDSVTTSEEDYTVYEYDNSERQLIKAYENIDLFQSKRICYQFGSEYKFVSKYDLAKLLNNNEDAVNRIYTLEDYNNNLNFDISKEKADDYICSFLDEYNTYNNRHFITHCGAEVYVKKGNYGNKLNLEREKDWFEEFINSDDIRATRTPEYLIEAKYREKNDFGDTFIEVSLDEQYLWYYVDGEIFVETPITSGSMAHGGTDPRVVYVYTKIPNKWLTGPTWHSFVKYWVAIQGAIGIHDASWRSVYGGKEYLYNGSHGCINTPLEAMEKIYNRVEIGTPVIVYSVEKNGVNTDNLN